MDFLSIIGFSITGFIAMLVLLFMMGFKVNIPREEIDFEEDRMDDIEWPLSVPELVLKHYESIFENSKIPMNATAVVQGTAKYKISNLWMPVKYTTWYQPREGFLRELTFYWYGQRILKGIDFWHKGVGAIQVNGVMRFGETGEHVTESQWVSYWAESFLTGTLDLTDPRLKWENVNDHSLALYFPKMDQTETQPKKQKEIYSLLLVFSKDTYRLESIQTERYRGQKEKKRTTWIMTVTKWERNSNMWLPEYSVKWIDQKKPWCNYRITKIDYNVDKSLFKKAFDKIQVEQYKKPLTRK